MKTVKRVKRNQTRGTGGVSIPKGFRHKAQGCEGRATLGLPRRDRPTPTGLGRLLSHEDATPLELKVCSALSQGSSFLATLGWRTQSLRDSQTNKTKSKQQSESKVMNNKFDELAKRMAQAVTRRQALRHFGTSLGALLLAAIALPRTAHAGKFHDKGKDTYNGYCVADPSTGTLTGYCNSCNYASNSATYSPDCAAGAIASGITTPCGFFSVSSTKCKFVSGY